MRQLTYTSLSQTHWLRFTCGEKKIGKISEKLPQNFLLRFTSLLTVRVVKNSHISTGIYLIFLKEVPRRYSKVWQHQIWNSVK